MLKEIMQLDAIVGGQDEENIVEVVEEEVVAVLPKPKHLVENCCEDVACDEVIAPSVDL